MNELKNAFLQQAETCGKTSLLYHDMIEIFGNYEPVLTFLTEKVRTRRTFQSHYEIVLTFVSFFHFMVLSDLEYGKLKRFFSTMGGSYSKENYDSLRENLLHLFEENTENLEDWMLSVILQTNEVNRCNAIYPAILSLGIEKINLVELGCSAGLIMLMDKYSYRFFNENEKFEILQNPPQLSCKTESIGRIKELFNRHPEVIKRVGLDLNPVDIHDDNNELMLKAALWDDPERKIRIEAAIQTVKQAGEDSPVLIQFDYTQDLTVPLQECLTNEGDIVIYSSVSTYQIHDVLYNKLFERIKDLQEESGKKVFFIEYESLRSKEDTINITSEEPFHITVNVIHENRSYKFGRAHFHGKSVTVF